MTTLFIGFTLAFVACALFNAARRAMAEMEQRPAAPTVAAPKSAPPTRPTAEPPRAVASTHSPVRPVAVAPAAAAPVIALAPAPAPTRSEPEPALLRVVPAPDAAPTEATPNRDESRSVMLRDPVSGERAPAPNNYRFAKKWIKEALVSEGLLPRVYKSAELKGELSDQVKDALEKLKHLEKYQG